MNDLLKQSTELLGDENHVIAKQSLNTQRKTVENIERANETLQLIKRYLQELDQKELTSAQHTDTLDQLRKIKASIEKIKLVLPGVLQVEVKNQKPYPTRVSIDNLEQIKLPRTNEKQIYTPIVDALAGIKKEIAKRVQALILNKNPQEAIPVRLVDKKGNKFYNAVVGGGGQISSMPTQIKLWDGTNTVAVNNDNELRVVSGGHISEGNSTVQPLGASEVFTGTAQDNTENAIIIINAFSDVASAVDGLSFQVKLYGSDTWRVADVFTLPANTLKTWSFQTGGERYRVVYTNGDQAQSVFELETQVKHSNSKASSHRIQDSISTEDDAELTKSILSAEREGDQTGTFYNVGADVAGNLKTTISGISQDAGGRVRVSQLTTLGDYKTLNADRTLLLENAGTGTGAFTNNKYSMSVGSGEWLVRQSRRYHPYFSGKSQMVEMTFDNFGLQTGVTKRVGYFSSSATSPYTADLDGVWIENDGEKYTMKASRAGTETVSVNWTDWDNYEAVQNYNFNNFTVLLIDFLWLGGAVYRLWIKNGGGFTLLHTVHYAGSAQDIFIKSPNQPIRYEIRSSTGTGSLRYICAQCSTEGSINESGIGRTVLSGAVSVANIGTTYPVLAVRKQSTARDIAVEVNNLSVYPTSANDDLQWTLQLNPTLSAGLTYSAVANSALESAVGNGTITVTAPGTIIAGGAVSTNGQLPSDVLRQNFLSWLGSTLNNTMDEYVLCATPITSGITTYSSISYKEI